MGTRLSSCCSAIATPLVQLPVSHGCVTASRRKTWRKRCSCAFTGPGRITFRARSFTTWLFRIATNLALNSVRDNRYQKLEVSIDAPVSMDAEDGDERTMDVPEKHPNIEQHLVEEARRK